MREMMAQAKADKTEAQKNRVAVASETGYYDYTGEDKQDTEEYF